MPTCCGLKTAVFFGGLALAFVVGSATRAPQRAAYSLPDPSAGPVPLAQAESQAFVQWLPAEE